MFKRICNIVYSHSDYSDIWPLFFGQNEKYLPQIEKKIIFTDKNSAAIPKNYQQIIYDEKKPYASRLIECFEKLKKDYQYCLFSHEDMFLYDQPKIDKIARYVAAVVEGKFDFVKLIKAGDCVYQSSEIDENLFAIDTQNSKWIFAIQPTIWSIDAFLKILKKHKKDNIWILEEKAQKTCRKLKIKGAVAFGEGAKRGMYHWDNDIYPYVATAIVKGKWNMGEYDEVLKPLLKQYNVDVSKRGEFK